ncbi:Dabb family protein [soil metagenome]
MIRHTVLFTLRHPSGSGEERSFVDAAQVLATIPGVERFERLRQTSATCDFAFALSMEFADERAYGAYNVHPDHVRFVLSRWQLEVSSYQELDFMEL